jgi:YVTN family beta-propeller protein
MNSNNGNRSRAASARGFMVLGAVLAMGLASMARPAEAAPFAYVANIVSNTISVIDTATNMVVAALPLGEVTGIAITPDGKHAYVTQFAGSVSVIDTASNTVVATVTAGSEPGGVAVTPDGQHAYVTNSGSSNVSVIATATNTVVATVTVGNLPSGIAVTPDGTHVYVTNNGDNTVSVIATATNTVVATVPVGLNPFAVAVTPDGQHAYVANSGDNTVSVIATATNTVVATIPVSGTGAIAITADGKHAYVANFNFFGTGTVSVIATASNTVVTTVTVGSLPDGVAITPDGQHAYVANDGSGTVSVIATASNTVVDTVNVGTGAAEIGIVPPPPGVPFLTFNALLAIQFGGTPGQDAFGFGSNFTLSSTAPAINPVTQPVTLQVGSFATTIPIGSFVKQTDGSFAFKGVIDGVSLGALIKQTGTLRYAFQAQATGANLTGTVNTVYSTLIIGGDSGATSVTAQISH